MKVLMKFESFFIAIRFPSFLLRSLASKGSNPTASSAINEKDHFFSLFVLLCKSDGRLDFKSQSVKRHHRNVCYTLAMRPSVDGLSRSLNLGNEALESLAPSLDARRF